MIEARSKHVISIIHDLDQLQRKCGVIDGKVVKLNNYDSAPFSNSAIPYKKPQSTIDMTLPIYAVQGQQTNTWFDEVRKRLYRSGGTDNGG